MEDTWNVTSLQCLKEGFLFQHRPPPRRRRRYFCRLVPGYLYLSSTQASTPCNAIKTSQVIVGEGSLLVDNCTLFLLSSDSLVLYSAPSRVYLLAWLHAFKMSKVNQQDSIRDNHYWVLTYNHQPAFCNICREGIWVGPHKGLVCEVCQQHIHQHCALSTPLPCKWSHPEHIPASLLHQLKSTGDNFAMGHQWVEGNMVPNSTCAVCERPCGSRHLLQDYRCLWCFSTVHSNCRSLFHDQCRMGEHRLSVIPPSAFCVLTNGKLTDSCAKYLASYSPLLVYVNTRSGDNLGFQFMLRFKQLLNPAQVVDLSTDGPGAGLELCHGFDHFRILVCGGDGSVGWVLSEVDNHGLTGKCQVGVLPLGTGNDLSHVLGWGSSCDDPNVVPCILKQLERSHLRMLDRWGILIKPFPTPNNKEHDPSLINCYEDSINTQLYRLVNTNQYKAVVMSARYLCETVKDFVGRISLLASTVNTMDMAETDSMIKKCNTLQAKLDTLLSTLQLEDTALTTSAPTMTSVVVMDPSSTFSTATDTNSSTVNFAPKLITTSHLRPKIKGKMFVQRDALWARANSLKKVIRDIIDQAEKESTMDAMVGWAERISQEAAPEEQLPISLLKALDETSDGPAENQPLLDEVFDRCLPSCSQSFQPGHSSDKPPAQDLQGPHLSRLSSQSDPSLPNIGPDEDQSAKTPAVGSSSVVASCSASNGSYVNSSIINNNNNSNNNNGVRQFTERQRSKSWETCKHVALRKAMPVPWSPSQLLVPSLKEGQKTVVLGRTVIAKAFLKDKGNIFNSLTCQALLANAEALCAAAIPELEPTNRYGYTERCVMNNYFGIGLDAKISLDFHTKREEHPEKCRSRMKNIIWYGVLGGKELLQQTYRNLDQHVFLECDGHQISLPSLQGIVILNIQSYMGGVNFWGESRGFDGFFTPSYDDRCLEVVAVLGASQMGISKIFGGFQHHRIAQCHSVKITIMDEAVPVQVDGEAWMQSPGIIQICHKNRVPMLIRDEEFEYRLLSWNARQTDKRGDKSKPVSTVEKNRLDQLASSLGLLIEQVESVLRQNQDRYENLEHAVRSLSPLLAGMKNSGTDTKGLLTTNTIADIITWSRTLIHELNQVLWISKPRINSDVEPVITETLSRSNMLLASFCEAYSQKMRSDRCRPTPEALDTVVEVAEDWSSDYGDPLKWGIDEVLLWLDRMQLPGYKEVFAENDIRGKELLMLEKEDFKDLGITKVGHLKRLQSAILNLRNSTTAAGSLPAPV